MLYSIQFFSIFIFLLVNIGLKSVQAAQKHEWQIDDDVKQGGGEPKYCQTLGLSEGYCVISPDDCESIVMSMSTDCRPILGSRCCANKIQNKNNRGKFGPINHRKKVPRV